MPFFNVESQGFTRVSSDGMRTPPAIEDSDIAESIHSTDESDGMQTPPALENIDLAENWGEGLQTPPEARDQRCAMPYGGYIDAWKMSWKNAQELKRELPELSLYWSDSFLQIPGEINEGCIVITDYYYSLDCDDIAHVINEINIENWQYPVMYQFQDRPFRLPLPKKGSQIFERVQEF